MIRNILVALVGSLLGAGAVYMMSGKEPGSLPRSAESSGPSPVLPQRGIDSFAEASPFLAARVAAYRRAGELDRFADLEVAIEALLPTASRAGSGDIALEALLLRLVEIDPQRAVRYARDQRLDADLVVSMFRAWASVDPDAAIAELALTPDHVLLRRIATELVDLIAATSEDIERLAMLFDDVHRPGFVSDGLVRLAETDPHAALRQAMELDTARFRESTARRIAAEWARQDPLSALAALSEIRDPRIRHPFHANVVAEWASVDPDAAVDYLTRGDGLALFNLQAPGMVGSALDALVRHRPFAVLAAAEHAPAEAANGMRQRALRSIVSQDLSSAIAEIETLPAGAARDEMLSMVARALVREDTAVALQWAEQVQHRVPGAFDQVINAMAAVDLPQAVTLALSQPGGEGRIGRWLTSASLSRMDTADFQPLADTLHAEGASQSAAVARLMMFWAERDGDAALTWLVEQGGAIDEDHVRGLATGFLRKDMSLAAATVRRLPQELRGLWVSEVAAPYLRREPDAALAWLTALSGEPEYDAWVNAVVEQQQLVGLSPLGPMDPRTVIRVLDTVQAPTARATARAVTNWAQEDPRAAASWAQALNDPDARSAGVAAASGVWAVSDRAGAQRWAQTLPSGDVRDSALRAVLLQGIASHGAIDRATLSAFSSDRAMQEALSSTVRAFTNLGSREPDAAMDLARSHIDDGALLARIESSIDDIRDRGVIWAGDSLMTPIP